MVAYFVQILQINGFISSQSEFLYKTVNKLQYISKKVAYQQLSEC